MTLTPELRAFVAAGVLAALAESAFVVLLGVHVYALTHDPLALGWLGLSEAIPAIALVLPGGHFADVWRRREVAASARAAIGMLAAVLGLAHGGVGLAYAVAFLVGAARAFEEPAASGLEAQLLPPGRMMQAVSLIASFTRAGGLLGPVLGGILYGLIGPEPTFLLVAALLLASAAVLRLGIAPRPAPGGAGKMLPAIAEGLRFVFASQVLAGSMALDLFAVFFGGAAGLFPAFAADVLHEGPAAVGFLRAAASAGALAAMLVAARHPPRARAGVVLHLAVAGFGIGIIAFAFAPTLWLAMAGLVFVGACDGASVVIRRAIVRIAAPDALRGRVAAVRGLFLNATNELGTFESGVAAALLGVIPAIWTGGVITILVAGATAWRAPKLLGLDMHAMDRG